MRKGSIEIGGAALRTVVENVFGILTQELRLYSKRL